MSAVGGGWTRCVAGAAGAALLASLAVAGPAAARPVALRVTPERPLTNETVVVSFTAGRLKPEDRYVVGFQQTGTSSSCLTGYRAQLRPKRPGSRVTVSLGPNANQRNVLTSLPVLAGRYCRGPNEVIVGRITPDGVFTRIAKQRITFQPGPTDPNQSNATPLTLIFGTTSSISVTAPGRPDRPFPVSGVLRGTVPGKARFGTDLQATLSSGALQLSEIVPDPLCAGDRYLPEFALAPAPPSTLVSLANGQVTVSLSLVADPLSLAGCAAPAAPGTTTITLTGQRSTTDQLQLFPLTGTVSGVPIAPGVTGNVALNLRALAVAQGASS